MRSMRKIASRLAVAGLAIGAAGAASAEIAVQVADGKQIRAWDGVPGRTPDQLNVIELSGASPRVLATIQTPVSMIGAPTAVAVTADSRMAIVSVAQRLDNGGPTEVTLDDSLTVVDISTPSAPRIVQTVKAGPGASGVDINKAGTLAVVASTGDDSIRLYRISGGRLTPAGMVQLPYEARPTDAAFTPDGRFVLAVGRSTGRVYKLAVEGTNISRTGVAAQPGVQPYGVEVGPDGRYAFMTNLGGRVLPPGSPPPAGGRVGTVSVLDLSTDQIVNQVEVGPTPEHLVLSPDGRHMAVVVVNGSSAAPTSPNYNKFGLLKVFRIDGSQLTQVAEAGTGNWGQGAVWSKDGRRIFHQAAIQRELEAFDFNGSSLTKVPTASLKFESRPGTIAVAHGR